MTGSREDMKREGYDKRERRDAAEWDGKLCIKGRDEDDGIGRYRFDMTRGGGGNA